MVAEGTFFRILDAYYIALVQECWEKNRAAILHRLRQEEHVVVLGDGRMDSPGHCAQYCTYTTLEQESRDIVHIVTIDKHETNRNSVIIEKKCFIRTMDALIQEIPVTEVVMDAHPQISALLNPERGRYKEIHQSLDIWHATKNLINALKADMLTCLTVLMMWHGVLRHVRNQHSWATGCCEHEPLDEGSQNKPWIQPAAHQALTAIVLDKRWLSQVKKFINFRDASTVMQLHMH
ncbi:unnamed protein product [Leuciscus chuanchicus]